MTEHHSPCFEFEQDHITAFFSLQIVMKGLYSCDINAVFCGLSFFFVDFCIAALNRFWVIMIKMSVAD
jgi:hypothetical protein